MMTFGSYLLTGFAALLAVPTAVFLFEVLAASFLSKAELIFDAEPDPRGRVAVLVPAHNESVGLQPTLADLKSQLRSGDRLLVVADNCSDDTAEVAASMGAEIAVRNDPTKIGKGYALDWGLNYLAANPPEIVIVIDADCRIEVGTIDRLATACEKLQRPVQSLYLMTAPIDSQINHQVAEFAWRLKNWVRPLGLSALNLPCQLMGTGMAFPWDLIRSAELSSGFIVEDLKLGLELAYAGHAPVFCPSARVTSSFPYSAKGARTQRQRWEQGHVGLILTKALALLYAALKQRNLNLLALTLDLIVPPISLLGLILALAFLGAGIAWFLGFSAHAVTISAISLAMVVGATALAWLSYGRDILPLKSLALIVPYFMSKLRLYSAALTGHRVSLWVRADRDKSDPSPGE